jgi:anaerobic dimethyl sulfoxide reductase subunit C
MTEWPLVLFTVTLQMACGLALAATLFDYASGDARNVNMRRHGVAIFPLTALALLASLFHLGRPWSALRALLNLGSSRLSLEILFLLLFALVAAGYSLSWQHGTTRGRFALGITTSLAGIATVISSSAIYMFPTMPAWYSAWLPVSFLGTVLLFAGIVPAAFVKITCSGLLKTYLMLGIAGALAHLVSITWLLAGLSRTTPDYFTAARLQGALRLLTSNHVVPLGLHFLLTVVLPVALVVRLWPFKLPSSAAPASGTEAWPLKIVIILAVAAGVILGRTLMYIIGTSIPPF